MLKVPVFSPLKASFGGDHGDPQVGFRGISVPWHSPHYIVRGFDVAIVPVVPWGMREGRFMRMRCGTAVFVGRTISRAVRKHVLVATKL